MATVGKLNIVLDASTKGLTKGLNKADRGLKGVKSSAGGAGKGMAAMAGPAGIAAAGLAVVAVGALAAVAGMAKLIMKTSEYGDEVGKTAVKSGVSTDALQELRHAAELSGASTADLDKALQKLSKNSNDASRGIGTAKKAFDEMGISVKNSDGSLKASDQLMGEVGDQFADMENGALKTALAQDIFGKSGVEMIPMLNAGAEGMASMRDEAQDLGKVLSGEAVKDSEDFQDAILKIQGVVAGIGRNFSSTFLPAATLVVDTVREITQAFSSALPSTDGMRESILKLTKGGLKSLIEGLKSGNEKFISLLGTLKKGAPFISGVAQVAVGVAKGFGIMNSTIGIVRNTILSLVGGALTVIVKGLVAVQQGMADLARAAGAGGLADSLQKGADAGRGLGDMLEDVTKNRIAATADGMGELTDKVTGFKGSIDAFSTDNIVGGIGALEGGAKAAQVALENLNITTRATSSLNQDGGFFTPQAPERAQGPVKPEGFKPKEEEDKKKSSGKTQEQKNELLRKEIEIFKAKTPLQKAELERELRIIQLRQEGTKGLKEKLALLKSSKKIVEEEAKATEKVAAATAKTAATAAKKLDKEGSQEAETAKSEAAFALQNMMIARDELGKAELARKILLAEIETGLYGKEEAKLRLNEAQLAVLEAQNSEKAEQSKKDAKAVSDQNALMSAIGGTIGQMGNMLGLSFDIGAAWNATIGIMDGVKAAVAATSAIAATTGILGIIGAAASLISVFASSGADKTAPEKKTARKAFDKAGALKDQAKAFAKAFADEQEKRLGRPVQINVDARGALTGEANEVARTLTDLVQGELATRVGGSYG